MMDRIDLHVDVPAVTAADLALPPSAEGTQQAGARVAAARSIQEGRAEESRPWREPETLEPIEAKPGGSQDHLNARLEGRRLEMFATPDEGGRVLLSKAAEAAGLSARGWTRTLRLARTIADLDGASGVRRVHVAEALIYRRTPMADGSTSGGSVDSVKSSRWTENLS